MSKFWINSTNIIFFSLINIFEINGLPSETNPYLCNFFIPFLNFYIFLVNGDFVDRGSFSIEVILTLFGNWVFNNWKL